MTPTFQRMTCITKIKIAYVQPSLNWSQNDRTQQIETAFHRQSRRCKARTDQLGEAMSLIRTQLPPLGTSTPQVRSLGDGQYHHTASQYSVLKDDKHTLQEHTTSFENTRRRRANKPWPLPPGSAQRPLLART